MLDLRPSRVEDAHYLIDIDLKCFDYAWSPAEWRDLSKDCYSCVATWNNTPVGMCVFRKTPDGDVEIVKVAVKPPFRGNGIGRLLVFNCILFAREVMATRLCLIVPESYMTPGDPDDIGGWLKLLGFKAGTPLLKNAFHHYGRNEDGVVFSLSIPLGNDVTTQSE